MSPSSTASDARRTASLDADDDPHSAEHAASPPPSSVSVRSIAVSLAISVLVLSIIGYVTFDPASFWQMLYRMEASILLAALGATLGRAFAGGWRLHFVSQGRLDLPSGIRGQLAWDFFSSVTPSAIGGGPVTTFYIARDRGITVGEATAFILFSVLLDQIWFLIAIPLLFVASLMLPVIPDAVGSIGLWSVLAYFGVLATWAGLFAYTMLVRPHLLERLAHRCFRWRYLRRFRKRVLREMRAFARRAERLRTQPLRFYIQGLGITALIWMGRYLLIFLVVRSVYAHADALLMVLRTAAMTLLGLIMPTPGGSGGIEGLYALFIGPLIPSTLVAPTLLTWRFLGYYLFIALGAYLFLHQIQRMIAADRTAASSASEEVAPKTSVSATADDAPAPALNDVD